MRSRRLLVALKISSLKVVILAAAACLVLAGNLPGLGPTQVEAEGDGTEKRYVLLVNAMRSGYERQRVGKDILELKTALSQDDRPGPTPATPSAPVDFQDFKTDIINAFGAADKDDVCILYLGTHGGRVRDRNGDEADGWDGVYRIGRTAVLDDDLDDPFKQLAQDGKCGAGMVLMFMACHSGELIDDHGATVNANDDFAGLPGASVVMTSCKKTEKTYGADMGSSHKHTSYGGRGLVRGLSDIPETDGIAEADANSDKIVSANELHAYAVANIADTRSHPQSSDRTSSTPGAPPAPPPANVLKYQNGTPASHNSPNELENLPLCFPVGGIAELPDVDAAPLEASGPSSSG